MKTIKIDYTEWTLKLYNKDELNKFIKATWANIEWTTIGMTTTNPSIHTTYVIVLWDYWNTVPHEITHFVMEMFEALWIEWNSELFAYHIWYYTKLCFTYLKTKNET